SWGTSEPESSASRWRAVRGRSPTSGNRTLAAGTTSSSRMSRRRTETRCTCPWSPSSSMRPTERSTTGSRSRPARRCGSGTQAWTSLHDELKLGLPSTAIGVVATRNSPDIGETSITDGVTTYPLKDKIWVTTPPPAYAAYLGAGGRYQGNQGVVFVRVDRDVRSFLGGVLGITPGPRTGWATAGALDRKSVV